MKQFLYVDIDIVNSIIAQAEKGLISELSSEHSGMMIPRKQIKEKLTFLVK